MEGLLFDSDIIIDYLRAHKPAHDFVDSASKESKFYLSVITLAEIYSGQDTKDTGKLIEIEKFLANFEVALLTPDIAKSGGNLRRDHKLPFADTLIAATALEYGLGLVTRNIKDFQKVPRLNFFKPY